MILFDSCFHEILVNNHPGNIHKGTWVLWNYCLGLLMQLCLFLCKQSWDLVWVIVLRVMYVKQEV